MNKNTVRYTSGISLSGLLGIVFLVLKLCNIINWSWWFVLMPFYAPTVIVIVVFTVLFIYYSITDKDS